MRRTAVERSVGAGRAVRRRLLLDFLSVATKYLGNGLK